MNAFENTWRYTIADVFALATPILILGGLALLGGGFDVEGRHLAGAVAWLLVLVLLVSPYRHRVRLGPEFALVAGLMFALAAFTAASALWSDAAARSLTEAERAIAYLGFFCLSFLVCQTKRQRHCFVEGLALALGLIVLLALGDRCLPGSDPITGEGVARLKFPLGYWNAMGVVFGIAVVTSAWLGRRGTAGWLRVAGVALIPAAVVGLYLTYSRGGFVAAGVSLLCLFFLSRDRLWLVGVSAIGVVCAVPVLKLVQASPTIAENLGGEAAPGEGRLVALALIAAMAVSVAVVWGILRLARDRPATATRALDYSRRRRVVWGAAGAIVAALAVAAIVFGPKAWDSYAEAPVSFPDDPGQHLTQLSSNGRYEQNKVAIRAFGDHPLLGIGAGTFLYEWNRERPNILLVQDAHSLYLESFAELGVVGGLLTLGLIGSMLWLGSVAYRRTAGADRERVALIVAVTAALALAFGIDWFWELGATGALLMMVGALLTAEAAGLRNAPRRPVPAARGVVGAAVAWAAIVLLIVPALAERAIEQSASASLAGRVDESIDQARLAEKLNPLDPEPHIQIGVIADAEGLFDVAIAEFTRAIELEPDNWRTYYMRLVARSRGKGDLEAMMADLERARELNPRAPELDRKYFEDSSP